ncbi:Uncharacterized protein dnm_028390 [Desulfonema magnum]|uniref:Uncharacterized protein n=1 Tax=Desulfonema magnum TaxID=45655 RepID=A0A975BKK4_9BACT|nr:Uncharacterized protein dnm_028390 [Desulfonema magnum]
MYELVHSDINFKIRQIRQAVFLGSPSFLNHWYLGTCARDNNPDEVPNHKLFDICPGKKSRFFHRISFSRRRRKADFFPAHEKKYIKNFCSGL